MRFDPAARHPDRGGRATWRPDPAIERFREIQGVGIRYLEGGEERPGLPLLMLHGYGWGADIWFPRPFPALSDRFHVVAPDVPGFGRSDPPQEYSLETYTALLSAFVDSLGHERILLLGHSFGGQLAIPFAAAHPDRIARLVLVDSSGVPRDLPKWRSLMSGLGDSSSRHYGLWATELRLARQATAHGRARRLLRGSHIEEYLRSVTMPTLVVWGSRDRVVPLEHGAFLARNIPLARLAIIRGAGHMPFYQKPAEFNRLVTGFLTD